MRAKRTTTFLFQSSLYLVLAYLLSSTMPLAHAEVSASVAVSNFYLFRGKNLSNSQPAISGSLDASHSSGAYAGVWASNEGSEGQETDLYIGYVRNIHGLSIDLNVTAYQYPQAEGESYGDQSELIIHLSYDNWSLTLADALQGSVHEGGYIYYQIAHEWDRLGISYGHIAYDSDQPEPAHLDIHFHTTDELTFTTSILVKESESVVSQDKDPLFNISWTKTFNL